VNTHGVRALKGPIYSGTRTNWQGR